MIPEKIKYTSQFEYRNISEWISIEGSLEEGESFTDALIKAKEIVIDAYKAASPDKLASGEMIIQKDVDMPIKKPADFMVKKQMANAVLANDQNTIDNLNQIYNFNVQHKEAI